MIIEAIIGSITSVTIGSFWLAARLVKIQMEDDNKYDPATIKSKRAAITEKKRIWLDMRKEYVKSNSGIPWLKNNWDEIIKIDKKLMDLADEEAEIPTLDE